jgi:hypothetical protein
MDQFWRSSRLFSMPTIKVWSPWPAPKSIEIAILFFDCRVSASFVQYFGQRSTLYGALINANLAYLLMVPKGFNTTGSSIDEVHCRAWRLFAEVRPQDRTGEYATSYECWSKRFGRVLRRTVGESNQACFCQKLLFCSRDVMVRKLPEELQTTHFGQL